LKILAIGKKLQSLSLSQFSKRTLRGKIEEMLKATNTRVEGG
jgi:hypothetical protein